MQSELNINSGNWQRFEMPSIAINWYFGEKRTFKNESTECCRNYQRKCRIIVLSCDDYGTNEMGWKWNGHTVVVFPARTIDLSPFWHFVQKCAFLILWPKTVSFYRIFSQICHEKRADFDQLPSFPKANIKFQFEMCAFHSEKPLPKVPNMQPNNTYSRFCVVDFIDFFFFRSSRRW